MSGHEWHETGEDGERRYHRATRKGGRWSFLTTRKSDPDWTTLDSPSEAFLEGLVDLLQRKYQRRRVPHGHLLEIEAMLAEAREHRPDANPGTATD